MVVEKRFKLEQEGSFREYSGRKKEYPKRNHASMRGLDLGLGRVYESLLDWKYHKADNIFFMFVKLSFHYVWKRAHKYLYGNAESEYYIETV